MNTRRTIISLLTLLLALFPAHAGAHAHTLRVGVGGDYAALADALAVAAPGATIELLPGVQTGQWTITTPLTLRGQPGAILDGGGQGTLLTIAASGVTIEGLTIRNTGRSLLDDDAALLVLGDDMQIERNRLEDVHHAVYVKDGAARTVVRHNVIHGRAALMQEDRGNGIHLWDAPDALVEHNDVVGVRDGIYVGFAPRSAFRDNTFRKSRYGIHFMYADDNIFERNIFEESEAGAALMYSKRITLRQNVFAHSHGSRAYGLLLQECDNVIAEDNLLIDNSRALFVNVTRDSVFHGNLFVANDLAVQIYAGSTDNTFQGNDFVGNLQLVELDLAGSNRWEGNYWDEYHGIDADGDGFGDAPFRTGDPLGTLTTDHPQLRLFRFSPAVQALEASERAFPVMQLPEIRDERPALRPIAQQNGRLPSVPGEPQRVQITLILLSLLWLLLGRGIVWAGQRMTAARTKNQELRTENQEPRTGGKQRTEDKEQKVRNRKSRTENEKKVVSIQRGPVPVCRTTTEFDHD